MTVLLLIDAFRWDYVGRTRFIQQLAGRATRGNFIEPFGFVPRACYFGGLTPEEVGFTHLFHRDPKNSPFGLSTGLRRLKKEVLFGQDQVFRERIVARSRSQTTDFGASYLSTLNIPLHLLGEFQLSEIHAPWENGHGYTSIFDLLDVQKRKWFQCSWPLSTRLPRQDDRSLIEHCVAHITAEHEFVYVHLGELDWCGHLHGPESGEIREKLEQVTDPCVEQLYQHCLRVSGGDLNFILFGDHGMVTITKTIDLWEALESSGLKLRHDYMCFLDSTMARFWFQHREARERITALLRGFKEGSVLEGEDLQRHHIGGCHPSNAELIFMAHPGVVIQPNFFEFSPQCGIRGMHGYDPDCRENQGAIIVHDREEGLPMEFERGVAAWELFPLLLDRLKLEHPCPHRMPAARIAREKGFTPVPAAEAGIREQVRVATEEIRRAIPQARAIYLGGGFGRGEGTVKKNRESGYGPVNDYDFGVIVDDPRQTDTGPIRARLARQLDIDYVDINVTTPFNKNWGACQSNYDLRHGTRVLLGDGRCLEDLPTYSACEIQVEDALKLIFNRCAGVLTAPVAAGREGLAVRTESEDYLCYQIAKLLLGIGDAMLIAWKAYDVSYATKRGRIADLLRGHPEFTAEEMAAIDYGYAIKLSQRQIDLAEGLTWAAHVPSLLDKALPTICREPGRPKPALEECFGMGNARCRRHSPPAGEKAAAVPPPSFFQKLLLLSATLLAANDARDERWRQFVRWRGRDEEPIAQETFTWEDALRLKEAYRVIWETHYH